ncbi:PIG-L family deacetylase [Subtercola sp. YIM 133946]|uniref:PIG-L family deacetylase n=1 Tax=Subtercola sp. YIM 133946 TaxID=3118909 RepID=UPI002F944A49
MVFDELTRPDTDVGRYGGTLDAAVVLLHAHPDDETLSTGGLMARLAADGVRVVLITGTRGERGEVVPGPLKRLEGSPGLAETRVAELDAAMVELGVGDHRFLGAAGARAAGLPPRRYSDSGMQWESDGVAIAAEDAPADALSRAQLDEIIADVLSVTDEVHPQVLVSYDANGGYGHPDHVRMHDAAVAVAARIGVPVYTIVPRAVDAEIGDHVVPLGEFRPAKRRALAAHRTQLTVDGDEIVLSGGQRSALNDSEVFRRWVP